MALIINRRRIASPEPADATRVGSVRTFLDALERFERTSKLSFYYRGHPSFTYQLKPSVYREESWIAFEDQMFKELVLRCPNDLSSLESTFQTLVKMQHYGLPTRLLDLTSNPLIALFFATDPANPTSESGEVVVFGVPKAEIKYFDSDTVSVIANLSRRPGTFSMPGANLTKAQFNKDERIRFLLHEIKHEKPYFEPMIVREHLESVVCVKPKMDNPRVLKQDGAFFLFGVNGKKTEPASVSKDYIASSDALRILVIGADKRKIRQQLESLGISKGTVFPEIERVAEYIKSTYIAKSET